MKWISRMNLRGLLIVLLCGVSLFFGVGAAKKKTKAKSTARASPSLQVQALKEGDFLFPKALYIFEPGEVRKPFESTTFEPGMNQASAGRCEVEILTPAKEIRRALGKVSTISKIETQEDVPGLNIDEFLKIAENPLSDLINDAVVVDETEGIAFRNDDVKVRIPELLDKEPWILVPAKSREAISQSIFTHIWSYWGDIQKFRKKSSSEIRKQKSQLQPKALQQILKDTERLLRGSAKNGKIFSDQITNYQVKFELEKPARLKISCDLEGKKKDFSLERLNRMLSPYYEVIPAAEYSQMDLNNNLPPKAVLPSGVEGL